MLQAPETTFVYNCEWGLYSACAYNILHINWMHRATVALTNVYIITSPVWHHLLLNVLLSFLHPPPGLFPWLETTMVANQLLDLLSLEILDIFRSRLYLS